MADQYEIACPMPGCGEMLFLEWEASTSLVPEDIDGSITEGIGIDAATCHTWKVVCLTGHVILAPGDPGCGCADPEGPDCECDQDVYDHADEYRTFRPHDRDRLIQVVGQLRSLS